MPSIEIGGLNLEYSDTGTGPPIVFVHGAYVTGAVWDDVVTALSATHRCIAPTWPFGAQASPVGPADLGVVAAGRRIVGLLDNLDLDDVTLVANDTGGGVVLAALGDPQLNFDRVSRLVFTNCDSFEHFPPKSLAPLVKLCQISTTAGALVLRTLSTGPGLKLFASAVARHGIRSDRLSAIFGGFVSSRQVRREAARFSAGLDPKYTSAAAPAVTAWPKPVRMAWGADDSMFPLAHARRLAMAFPVADVRTIKDSSTYVMIDQPDHTASAIADFVAR